MEYGQQKVSLRVGNEFRSFTANYSGKVIRGTRLNQIGSSTLLLFVVYVAAGAALADTNYVEKLVMKAEGYTKLYTCALLHNGCIACLRQT